MGRSWTAYLWILVSALALAACWLGAVSHEQEVASGALADRPLSVAEGSLAAEPLLPGN